MAQYELYDKFLEITGPFDANDIKRLSTDGMIYDDIYIRKLPNGKWRPISVLGNVANKRPIIDNIYKMIYDDRIGICIAILTIILLLFCELFLRQIYIGLTSSKVEFTRPRSISTKSASPDDADVPIIDPPSAITPPPIKFNSQKNISKDKYDSLIEGMSYNDAMDIIENEPTDIYNFLNSRTCLWINSNGSSIHILFHNDKLVEKDYINF